jgi:NAD(P)H dehydrogenase (quinone)
MANDCLHEKECVMSVKIKVVFYSMYGHLYRMAEAVAEGARSVEGTEVTLLQVAELAPPDMLEKSGAAATRAVFAHVPVAEVEDLRDADGLLFGTPTRYGNMCGQMRNFLDQTGGLWVSRVLEGKPAGVFTASATQHGGQETTITSFHSTLLHHGMLIVGVPYSEPALSMISEISGGSPYGASSVVGHRDYPAPTENELSICRVLGARVATIATKLKHA